MYIKCLYNMIYNIYNEKVAAQKRFELKFEPPTLLGHFDCICASYGRQNSYCNRFRSQTLLQ